MHLRKKDIVIKGGDNSGIVIKRISDSQIRSYSEPILLFSICQKSFSRQMIRTKGCLHYRSCNRTKQAVKGVFGVSL